MKDKAQKQLDKEAHHDIGKYVENAHRIVCEVETQYGVKFTYGTRQGGEEKPPRAPMPVSTHKQATRAKDEPRA